ncbi:hypothetical protein [Sulfuracidifex metallicus]|uniref:hypothetical protein n=1 Tax=Sulfuracidifex metallicus TaxID=47303 RepID=UPI0006CF412B|nr:hypothetical protein [Sulfuracidifex metallicus]
MDPLIKKGVDYLKSAKILFDNEYYEQAMAMIFYGLPYLIKGIVKEKQILTFILKIYHQC